jgi:hypothetical protein
MGIHTHACMNAIVSRRVQGTAWHMRHLILARLNHMFNLADKCPSISFRAHVLWDVNLVSERESYVEARSTIQNMNQTCIQHHNTGTMRTYRPHVHGLPTVAVFHYFRGPVVHGARVAVEDHRLLLSNESCHTEVAYLQSASRHSVTSA